MTMSLSVARPIVAEPAGFCSAPDQDGSNAWNIFVARFDTDVSGGLAALGAICVCGAWFGDAACPTPDICGCGWKFAGGGEPGGYAPGRGGAPLAG